MNHTNSLDDLKDKKAERREKRKRPRMRMHGKALKKISTRSIMRIHKVTKK